MTVSTKTETATSDDKANDVSPEKALRAQIQTLHEQNRVLTEELNSLRLGVSELVKHLGRMSARI